MRGGRWGAVLEAVTGISVVISLVVLILEVRGNTRALERQILMDRATAIGGSLAEGPELMEAYTRVKSVDGWDAATLKFVDRYGMEPTAAVAWTRFLIVMWRGLEADYFYAGPSDRLVGEIRGALGFPDQRLFWDDAGLDPGFKAYVEEVAADVLAVPIPEPDPALPAPGPAGPGR